MGNRKILLGLTTTPKSNWRKKIKEIKKFGIEELALFPTFLEKAGRKELYQLLEKSGLKAMSHVHLRGEDMPPEELDYLSARYKTKVFNLHAAGEFPINYDYGEYKQEIFLENTANLPTEEELKIYAGLCIDFSHWEDNKIFKDSKDKKLGELVKKYPIGCGHVSAIRRKKNSSHWMNNINEIEYIKNYLEYLPEIISIELENPFEEQLEVKKYLEKIISQ